MGLINPSRKSMLKKEEEKKEKGLNISRKMELPKLNLKFQREAKFHHLSIKIPSSGFKAKKLNSESIKLIN